MYSVGPKVSITSFIGPDIECHRLFRNRTILWGGGIRRSTGANPHYYFFLLLLFHFVTPPAIPTAQEPEVRGDVVGPK